MAHAIRCLVATLVLSSLLAAATDAAEKPNFLFILADDLGYMDIKANNPGTFYETPNLDRLASTGMRFTQGYAANPVCSPTRFSIMTGRYPTRVGATNWFSGLREGKYRPAPLNDRMPLEEVTIAEMLKPLGYHTAMLGKWHLGPTDEFWPEHQGFDVNLGGHHKGSPPGGYFSPYRNPRLDDGPEGEHLPMRLAEETVNQMKQADGNPFFIYLAYHSVHTPIQAPEELVEKYKVKAESVTAEPEFEEEEQVWPVDEQRRVRVVQKHPTYAGMVESLDRSVGRVLEGLDELGLTDNTVVVFFSDNGGLSTSEGAPTSNVPLRGGKGWVYEGGIREPMIVRYPGMTKPGSVCETPVSSIDFLPTFADLAGASIPADRPIDGVSLVPLLKGESIEDRPLFWHYPHYGNQGGFPGGAVRLGEWKLIERYEDGRVHLYNIKEDISERTDLAQEYAARAEEMRTQLHDWYKDVDAKFLEALPNGPEPWQPGEGAGGERQ